ncbi:hypothetical protein C0995_010622 [Termitomyces sp. Mi166|nr:hypothetical protein C0995_010622 [Termitomyces sp. Mi166\
MSIQFSFQGTAIYVYFILANFVGNGITTETLCNFTLDDEFITQYHHIPTSSKEYNFNSLVFSKDGLLNKSHTLLISTSGLSRDVFTSFDYAIYQFDDGLESTTSQPSPTTTLDQPVVTVTPHAITTIDFGTPFITKSHAPIQSESPTSSSSGTISVSSPSSSISVTVIRNTWGALGTTETLGTTVATSSSSSGISTSENSNGTDDNNTAPTGAIAGGIIGGVALILILVILFILWHRRRRAHMGSPSTIPELTPRRPVLTPFTPFSNNPDIETRALDGRPTLSPVRKQRDGTPMNVPRSQHSASASVNSGSEMLRAGRQNMISEQINSLKKELDAPGSSASGSSRFGRSDVTKILQQNQEMKEEIERLQAQLNSDWALGLTNEAPPGYSRHPAGLTSSAAPVTVT